MTDLFTPEDRKAVLESAAATPILAASQRHISKSVRIMAVFVAVTVALLFWVVTRITSLGEENQKLAKDVRECTTPSTPKDLHECYDRARDDALRVRATRDAQYASTKAAADAATDAARRGAQAADAAQHSVDLILACNKPGGICQQASEENQRFIRTQLNTMLQTIQSFQFQVQGTINGETFKGTARPMVGPSVSPPPCQDTISLGDQALLPGLLCTKP